MQIGNKRCASSLVDVHVAWDTVMERLMASFLWWLQLDTKISVACTKLREINDLVVVVSIIRHRGEFVLTDIYSQLQMFENG